MFEMFLDVLEFVDRLALGFGVHEAGRARGRSEKHASFKETSAGNFHMNLLGGLGC